MPADIARRRAAFRALHERAGCFVMPNPWDAGTAAILAALGFEALATSSAAAGWRLAKPDHHVARDEMLVHVAEIVAATDLPVSADLENGYGHDPAIVAETVSRAVAAGCAGCSIEDATGVGESPLYDIELAAERIRAARAAIDEAGIPFVLTARAECFLVGHPDPLAESIRRLKIYAAAGADCVFAPGAADAESIGAIVRAVDLPVNVLGGLGAAPLSVKELADLGVKRVSLGANLARAAISAFWRAASELKDHGTFGFLADALASGKINAMFRTLEETAPPAEAPPA